MVYCTLINCIDGRVQGPASEYVLREYGCDYIDTVTEAGPVRMFADGRGEAADSVFRLVEVSLSEHGSRCVAIAAHADCAANRISDEEQQAQVRKAAAVLSERYPGVRVVGLWIDAGNSVREVCSSG